ncbi:MAG: phage tail protein [Leptolyngbya sp.]|nr:phage tail protein [Leptolyngbya sp.]
MAAGEILACSKFYVSFDGLEDLVVKKVSGVAITLETAGDSTPFGVTKDGKSQIQATVTGTSNGKLTVEYVAAADDRRLLDWYESNHSEPIEGGGSSSKGERKTGAIVLYNQGGEEAARWDITGAMCSSYAMSGFEAGATDLATETVEVAIESLHRVK